jgi:hypothetical protein
LCGFQMVKTVTVKTRWQTARPKYVVLSIEKTGLKTDHSTLKILVYIPCFTEWLK